MQRLAALVDARLTVAPLALSILLVVTALLMLSLHRAITCPITLPFLKSRRDEPALSPAQHCGGASRRAGWVTQKWGCVPGEDSLCLWVTPSSAGAQVLRARRVLLV